MSYILCLSLLSSYMSPYSIHPGVGETKNASLTMLSWKVAKCRMKVKKKKKKHTQTRDFIPQLAGIVFFLAVSLAEYYLSSSGTKWTQNKEEIERTLRGNVVPYSKIADQKQHQGLVNTDSRIFSSNYKGSKQTGPFRDWGVSGGWKGMCSSPGRDISDN